MDVLMLCARDRLRLQSRFSAQGTAQDTFAKIGVKYTIEGLTGNTFDSHRLIAFAGRQGVDVQDSLVEQLFRSYFEQVSRLQHLGGPGHARMIAVQPLLFPASPTHHLVAGKVYQ